MQPLQHARRRRRTRHRRRALRRRRARCRASGSSCAPARPARQSTISSSCSALRPDARLRHDLRRSCDRPVDDEAERASALCWHSSTTVRAKFGSSICGIESSSDGASDGTSAMRLMIRRELGQARRSGASRVARPAERPRATPASWQRRTLGIGDVRVGQRRGIEPAARVADGDGEVAAQRATRCARHRGARDRAPSSSASVAATVARATALEGRRAAATLDGRSRRARLVVGTDVLADVAAVDVRPDGGAQRRVDGSALARSSDTKCSARVEHVRLDERAGRTRLEAQRARAALIEPGASGSSGRVVMISPRNSQEPELGLIRQVFLPIQPRPACCA